MQELKQHRASRNAGGWFSRAVEALCPREMVPCFARLTQGGYPKESKNWEGVPFEKVQEQPTRVHCHGSKVFDALAGALFKTNSFVSISQEFINARRGASSIPC
jgi:hypothetical protein